MGIFQAQQPGHCRFLGIEGFARFFGLIEFEVKAHEDLMAEAVNDHRVTNGILQAFVACGELPGTMIKDRIRLCNHHNTGRFVVA